MEPRTAAGREPTVLQMSPSVRWRFRAYALGLVAELVLIIACFTWMAESPPCLVRGGALDPGDNGQEACVEGLYLFFTFYMALAKGLSFFFGRVQVEGLAAPNPDMQRVAGIVSQYVTSCFYFAFMSAMSATIYCLQPTMNNMRKLVYSAFGAGLNVAMAMDCCFVACSVRARGFRLLFRNIREVKPFAYRSLNCKERSRVWYLKECAICLEDFRHEDTVLRLPCGHLFHTDCVADWLRKTMACPLRCDLGCFVLALPPRLSSGSHTGHGSGSARALVASMDAAGVGGVADVPQRFVAQAWLPAGDLAPPQPPRSQQARSRLWGRVFGVAVEVDEVQPLPIGAGAEESRVIDLTGDIGNGSSRAGFPPPPRRSRTRSRGEAGVGDAPAGAAPAGEEASAQGPRGAGEARDVEAATVAVEVLDGPSPELIGAPRHRGDGDDDDDDTQALATS